MYLQRFGDDRRDAMTGIHTPKRILKDHLGMPSQSPFVITRYPAERRVHDAGFTRSQPLDSEEGPSKCGLAGPRLTDETKSLSSSDVEIDAVNRAQHITSKPWTRDRIVH